MKPLQTDVQLQSHVPMFNSWAYKFSSVRGVRKARKVWRDQIIKTRVCNSKELWCLHAGNWKKECHNQIDILKSYI